MEAGDRLHVLVRQEAADEFGELIERWRTGPIGPPERRRRSFGGHAPIFSVRPGPEPTATPPAPRVVAGKAVLERLRNRYDQPGAVVALEDGRYAVTGPLLIIGSARQVRRQARKCLRQTDDDVERAWWQEVIGALAR